MNRPEKIRIAPMSDLHIEFEGRRAIKGPDLSAFKNNVDLVLLAGDIEISDRAIDYSTRLFNELECPVVQIAGNHEFYDGNRPRVLNELRRAADASPIHFLENQTAFLDIHGRQVRVLGTTLWTDYMLYGRLESAMYAAFTTMSDHREIYETSRDVFLPEHACQLHQRARAWLEEELAKPFDGVTIVMTHHAPSERSVPPKFKDNDLNAAYSSALDNLVENSGADIWVHGHTHTSFDYMIGKTRVICNPRGYYARMTNPGFQPDLVVLV